MLGLELISVSSIAHLSSVLCNLGWVLMILGRKPAVFEQILLIRETYWESVISKSILSHVICILVTVSQGEYIYYLRGFHSYKTVWWKFHMHVLPKIMRYMVQIIWITLKVKIWELISKFEYKKYITLVLRWKFKGLFPFF